MRFTARQEWKNLEAVGGVCCTKAYLDQGKVWTIAWGHTRNVHEGLTCTEQQGEAWIDDDLRGVEADIDRLVTAPITQGQRNAIALWHENCGGLTHPALRVVKLLNAGKYVEACNQMQRWNKSVINGVLQVNQGLVNRRHFEAMMFLSDMQQPTGAMPAPSPAPLSGEVPVAPPANGLATPAGKVAAGITASGVLGNLWQDITHGQTTLQPILDDAKQLFGFAGGYPELGQYALHGILTAVVLLGAYNLWQEHRRVTQ